MKKKGANGLRCRGGEGYALMKEKGNMENKEDPPSRHPASDEMKPIGKQKGAVLDPYGYRMYNAKGTSKNKLI